MAVETRKHEHLARALDGLGKVLSWVTIETKLVRYLERVRSDNESGASEGDCFRRQAIPHLGVLLTSPTVAAKAVRRRRLGKWGKKKRKLLACGGRQTVTNPSRRHRPPTPPLYATARVSRTRARARTRCLLTFV